MLSILWIRHQLQLLKVMVYDKCEANISILKKDINV